MSRLFRSDGVAQLSPLFHCSLHFSHQLPPSQQRSLINIITPAVQGVSWQGRGFQVENFVFKMNRHISFFAKTLDKVTDKLKQFCPQTSKWDKNSNSNNSKQKFYLSKYVTSLLMSNILSDVTPESSWKGICLEGMNYGREKLVW